MALVSAKHLARIRDGSTMTTYRVSVRLVHAEAAGAAFGEAAGMTDARFDEGLMHGCEAM